MKFEFPLRGRRLRRSRARDTTLAQSGVGARTNRAGIKGVSNLRQLLPRSRAPLAWSRLRSAGGTHLARLRAAIAPYWSRASEWYEKREPREKVLLQLLTAVIVGLLLYNGLYLPVRSLRDSLADGVLARQQEISHLRTMMHTYDRLQTELSATQKRTVPRGKDPALFSVVEMTLTNSVGRSKIASITPGDHQLAGGFEQYTVDVKLNDIALPKIVDALYELQTLNVPLSVSNFQVHQHASGTHSYDVDLTCTALGKIS